MATHYKKRRGHSGPSKNEEKVMRAKNALRQAVSGGALGARFPSVMRLSVRLVFLNAQQHVLEEKTLSLGLSDPCRFTVPCPGRCGVGVFDFTAKLESGVLAGDAVVEAGGKCQQPLYAGSPEVCGCEVKCRMEFSYRPKPSPAPAEPSAPPAPGTPGI